MLPWLIIVVIVLIVFVVSSWNGDTFGESVSWSLAIGLIILMVFCLIQIIVSGIPSAVEVDEITSYALVPFDNLSYVRVAQKSDSVVDSVVYTCIIKDGLNQVVQEYQGDSVVPVFAVNTAPRVDTYTYKWSNPFFSRWWKPWRITVRLYAPLGSVDYSLVR